MLRFIKLNFYRFLSDYHFKKSKDGTEKYVKHRRLGKIYQEKCAIKVTCTCGNIYDLSNHKFISFYCGCGNRIVFTNKS